jgi:hypothetical protein
VQAERELREPRLHPAREPFPQGRPDGGAEGIFEANKEAASARKATSHMGSEACFASH